MDISKKNLRNILEAKQVFAIPFFQRRYVWADKNWEALVDNVLSLEKNSSPHFMGTIVLVKHKMEVGKPPVFRVIDGQQRITTLLLMLCAMRDLASEQNDKDTAKQIDGFILNNHKYKNDENFRYKVLPRHWDRDSYFAIVNRNKTDSGVQSMESNITKAYDFIKKKIKGELEQSKCLDDIIDCLMDLLEFASIELDSTEEKESYKIFRSLNTLGVDLRLGDLIRNYVFMTISNEHQENFDDKYWRPLESKFELESKSELENKPNKIDDKDFETFFRMSLRMRGEPFKDADDYEKFEELYPEDEIKKNPGEFVRKYTYLVNYWDQIKGKQSSGSPKVDDALQHLGKRGFKIGVAYPLAMRLLKMREEKKITDTDAVEAFRLISGFFVRRHICGENSRPYAQWFCEVCSDLGDDPLDNLRAFLKDRKGGWPNDKKFEDAFVSHSLYDSKYRLPVLYLIERRLENDQKLALRINIDDCQVEHIMPQTLNESWKNDLGDDINQHKEWLHTLGNLTLLDSKGNRHLSNKSFEEKRGLFDKDAIPLNNGISKKRQWGIKEIKERGRKLAKIATRIWPGPGNE